MRPTWQPEAERRRGRGRKRRQRTASPRGLPSDELAKAATDMGIPAESAGEVAEAVRRALVLAGPDDVIFVAGSLYVAGAARDAYPALVD